MTDMTRANKKNLLSLYRIFSDRGKLSRRQACRLGVRLGLTLSAYLSLGTRHIFAKENESANRGGKPMDLMLPVLDGNKSLEKVIKQRRTVRSFTGKPVLWQQFSQILWAAQGITDDRGFKRSAPSGGALYPADVYAVVGKDCVENLGPGVYHYEPQGHSITKTAEGDRRKDVAIASLRQMWMADAPLHIIITAEYDRITIKYGKRGIRYALIETGHIGQNVFLQCQALGLEAGIVGAFNDRAVADAVGTVRDHEPLIILPVGWGR